MKYIYVYLPYWNRKKGTAIILRRSPPNSTKALKGLDRSVEPIPCGQWIDNWQNKTVHGCPLNPSLPLPVLQRYCLWTFWRPHPSWEQWSCSPSFRQFAKQHVKWPALDTTKTHAGHTHHYWSRCHFWSLLDQMTNHLKLEAITTCA